MFYHFIRIFFFPLLWLFFKPRVQGGRNINIKGRAIVIGNHVSLMDPVFVSFIFARKIFWMAKVELFRNKLFGGFLKAVGAFPVHRGEGDLASIRHAIKILFKEGILGIFPEGTRVKSKELRRFEPGVAMMALKTGSPVIPVYISGQYGIFRSTKIIIGEPIDLKAFTGGKATPEAVAHATEHLHARMTQLKNTLEGK